MYGGRLCEDSSGGGNHRYRSSRRDQSEIALLLPSSVHILLLVTQPRSLRSSWTHSVAHSLPA